MHFLCFLIGLYVDAGYLKVEGPKIIPGCQSKERCGGCGTGSCSGIWDKDVCSCDKGYTGPNCIDVCQLKPCLNEGICHRSSTATHGFICSCKPSFTGTYSSVFYQTHVEIHYIMSIELLRIGRKRRKETQLNALRFKITYFCRFAL